MPYILVLIGAYLIGTIPHALIVGKLWRGIDIRNYGSGNLGATNTFRVLGPVPGIMVLILDALKGMAAVYLGYRLAGPGWGEVLGGMMAIIGHTWPFYLGFKGGRGVATGAGIILALVPKITSIAVLVFVIVVAATRYVSLGSIISAALVPVLMLAFHSPFPYLVFGVVAASFVIARHRANMKRLLAGTELKIKFGQNANEERKQ